MDYLLFIVGLIMMYRKNYPWLFAIIIVLASTYLQLPLKSEMRMMIGPEHNVADTGLLLYLIFWSNEVMRNGLYKAHPMAKPVSFFLLFLLLNGLVDIWNGVSAGDVIRYLKHWAYLTIVFVDIPLQIGGIKNLIKIIFWITFFVSLILVVQYLLGVTWLGYTSTYNSYTRGAKPPSFAIICCCIASLNIFRLQRTVRIITSLVFSLPIVFSMKMSYFTTLCLILMLFYLLKQEIYIIKLLKYAIIGLTCLVVLFTAFPVFYQRFQSTVNQTEISSSQKEKGNFSYRIDHFTERLEYVLRDPLRSIRGLGYVQERNFHEKPFKLGQSNNWGQKAMLDTGDIAWSLLILRLGIFGIIFYLVMYSRFLRLLWMERYNDELVLIFFSYLFISLVFMSLGNALIAYSDFFIIPLLICGIKNEDSTLYLELKHRRC